MASADPFGTNPYENCQLFSTNNVGGELRQVTHFIPRTRSRVIIPGCFGPGRPYCSIGAGVLSGRLSRPGDEGSRVRVQLRPARCQSRRRPALLHAPRRTRAPPADRRRWHHDQPGRQLESRAPRAVCVLGWKVPQSPAAPTLVRRASIGAHGEELAAVGVGARRARRLVLASMALVAY
jgi:hypothetical protein